MIRGIGIDIIEINRVQEAVEKTKGFLEKTYTKDEIEYFKSRKMKYETVAGNFAGKEAFVKAMGTGFIGVEPKDIEILRDVSGQPYINVLKEEIKELLKDARIFITISHSQNYAVANVVIEE
ncbi:MAG TPA: holo-[acyl-carrier-protein] synthase [Clostridiales bacterium]|nr:MAG: holo-[acyl-carrier-protein] synthase [Clostridiales bacterium GWD2_32_19]HCC08203.1 holo-[acyl-carrier-protein] synthase [Clostridiales bacterium]